LLLDTLASVGLDILHPLQIILKERNKNLACAPLAPFEFTQLSPSLILHHLSWGCVDALVVQMELTRAREAENAVMLASTREEAKGLV
jgi:hypothetical protein